MMNFARVRSLGGLAYGLELAEAAAYGLPIWIVPWAFLASADVNSESVKAAATRLGSAVLRWSDAKNDEFTSSARRGDKHRKINRIPANATLKNLDELTASAVAVMPKTAAGAVLQRAVDVSTGCLADVEINGGKVEVELRTDMARLLVRNIGGRCDIEAIGSDRLVPGVEAVDALIGHLTTLTRRLPSTDHGWHIEGVLFPAPASFAVLQLRPTPADRPAVTAGPPERWTRRTRFVWGVFDVFVDVLASSGIDSDGNSVALVVREHLVDSLEQSAVSALEDGEPTLILNRASGFRLTHESFNLPKADLRTHFFAAHLSSEIPPRFRVKSDGDTAYFLET